MNKILIIFVLSLLVVSCGKNALLQKSDLLISNCTNKQIISIVISNETSVYKDTLQKQSAKKVYEQVRYADAPYPVNTCYDIIWLYNCMDSTYCLMSNYNIDNVTKNEYILLSDSIYTNNFYQFNNGSDFESSSGILIIDDFLLSKMTKNTQLTDSIFGLKK